MKAIPAAIAMIILAGCAEPETQTEPTPEEWARSYLADFRVWEEPMERAHRNATAAAEADHYGRAATAYADARFRAEAGRSWAYYNATPQYGQDLQDGILGYFEASVYFFDGAEYCYASRAAGSAPPPVCEELDERASAKRDAYEAMLDAYIALVPRRTT